MWNSETQKTIRVLYLLKKKCENEWQNNYKNIIVLNIIPTSIHECIKSDSDCMAALLLFSTPLCNCKHSAFNCW